MTSTAERITQEALRLSHDEKVELAERLLLSLDPAEMAEIERAWGEVAEARIDAYEAGKTTARPVEEVFADLDFRSAVERVNRRYAKALKKLAE